MAFDRFLDGARYWGGDVRGIKIEDFIRKDYSFRGPVDYYENKSSAFWIWAGPDANRRGPFRIGRIP